MDSVIHAWHDGEVDFNNVVLTCVGDHFNKPTWGYEARAMGDHVV